MILAESHIYGDILTAQKWSITTRTIRNFRLKMAKDTLLQNRFNELRHKAIQNWTEAIPPAIKAALDFIRRASIAGDVKDPKMLYAVVGAFKILSEIQILKEFANASIEQQGRQDDYIKPLNIPGHIE